MPFWKRDKELLKRIPSIHLVSFKALMDSENQLGNNEVEFESPACGTAIVTPLKPDDRTRRTCRDYMITVHRLLLQQNSTTEEPVTAYSPTENSVRPPQAAGVGLTNACPPTAVSTHVTWTRVYYATAQGHSASQVAAVQANSCRWALNHWLPPSRTAQSACGYSQAS